MDYLKSIRFLTLMFLIVTLTIGCLAMISVSQMERKYFREDTLQTANINHAENNTVTQQQGETVQEAWIVKAHDERIGVFKLDGELECVLDVYLITLPQADRKLLQEGIYVAGKERLTALMEDYTG